MLHIYEKLMKEYLKNNHILKYFLENEFWHFQKVCMNTSWLCAPNDLNTYPMCYLQACVGGLSTHFVHTKTFLNEILIGFNFFVKWKK